MPQNKIIYGPGRIPQASEFAIGEIIINVDDSKVYSKDKQNNVFELVGSVGAPDGFKFAYLSSYFESGSIPGDPIIVTQGSTELTSYESLGDVDTQFLDDLEVGDIIKIVSGAFSSFHEITSITDDQNASFTPPYQNNTVTVTSYSDTDAIIMARNESGSLFVTSSTSNRNIIFSGSSGVKITTGSQPQSIEISIDGTAVTAQAENIEGTLFNIESLTGQTGIRFVHTSTSDETVENGDTVMARALGLSTTSDVQFRDTLVRAFTATGDNVALTGIDLIDTEEHVVAISSVSGKLDYISTSSIIPRLQQDLTTVIAPYDGNDIDGDGEIHQRVGGADHNVLYPAGTTLETILREILIDYVGPVIRDTQLLNSSFGTVVPVQGGNHLEAGDNVPTQVKKFYITGDSDNLGNFFSNYVNFTLTGNQTTGGANNNTLSNISVSSYGTQVYIDFDQKNLLRTTPGAVNFSATVYPSNDSDYTRNTSVSLPFNSPVFCGASSINLGANPNQSNFETIIQGICGQGATTGVGCLSSRDSEPGGIFSSIEPLPQTILSYNTDGGISEALKESPSSAFFPPVVSINNRSVKLKPRGDGGAGSDIHLNSGYYIYMVYPASYGNLTHVTVPNGTELPIGGGAPFFKVIPDTTFSLSRFGSTKNYNVYQTFAPNMFNSYTGDASAMFFTIKT